MLTLTRISLLLFAGLTCLINSSAIAQKATVELYLKYNGRGKVKVYKPGTAYIDGKRLVCGKRPILIDNDFVDYGGAYPGFLILNQKKMRGLPKSVKLYIFAHECGHQFRGADEAAADCYSVKRGRREGWLDKNGLEKICKFMSPHMGDRMHPSGPERCKIMQRCFNEAFRNRDFKAELRSKQSKF